MPAPKPRAKKDSKLGLKGTPREPEPELPPPPDPEEIRRQTVEFSKSILDEVLGSAYDHIREKYLRSREVPFTVDRAIGDIMCIVEWLFIEHDLGEDKPESDPSWLIDVEPEATPIDSWARGVVPVKKRFKFEVISTQSSLNLGKPLSSGGQPSPPSNRKGAAISWRSGESAPLSPSSSRRASSPSDVTRKSNLSTGGSRARAMPTTTTLVKTKALTSNGRTSREEGTRDSYREEMAAREQAEMVQKRLEAELKSEVDTYEKLRRELSGKDFTYDRDGNVIVITMVPPDKIPSQNINLKVQIGPVAKDENGTRSDSRSNSRASRLKGRQSPAPKKSTDANARSEGHVLKSNETQPSMIEMMNVASGVTLKEGNRSKLGPKPSVNLHHMSKSDFNGLFHESLRHSPSRQTQQLTTDNSSVFGPQSPMAPLSPPPDFPSPVPASEIQPQTLSGPVAAAIVRRKTERPLASIPDADIEPTLVSTTAPSTADSLHQPEKDDPNLLLVRSPDWGRNPSQSSPHQPPSLPTTKAGVKERELTMGQRSRFPRDRQYPSPPRRPESVARSPPPFSLLESRTASSTYNRDFISPQPESTVRNVNPRAQEVLGL